MKYHSVFGQPAASMQKFIVTQMEIFRLLMHPPNDKATIFFDLKGFGLKQMDFVNLIYLVKVLESYYPESLGTMYISNAPLIFWGFWRAVKNILDPVVRNKIKFIASPADTEGDVPEDMMIEYCGGKVTSEFNFIEPREGENDIQQDHETKDRLLNRHRALTDKYEEVTRQWCKTGGKDEDLQEKRDILSKKIRLSQFELEPYTRGLTVYHRNGVLPPENAGISVFDYHMAGKPVRRQVLGRKTCRKSIEQELFAIVKHGAKVKDAQEQIANRVRDGSWGQWRVNDNPDEVKRVALASLDDPDNNGQLDTEHVDPQGTAAVAVQQAPKEIVEEYRQAAAQEQPQPPEQQQADDYQEPEERQEKRNGSAIGAAAGAGAVGGGAAAAAAASRQHGSSAASRQTTATPRQNGVTRSAAPNVDPNHKINAARPRGNSARSGPGNAGPTNYAKEEKGSTPVDGRRRSSLFGSIKSKIPGMA
jgi:hypothetical protein